uniref:Uncharacterized protein n=1 Tax=Tetranychus urticae TaxID=32264 RepID=T1L3G2_TETUR
MFINTGGKFPANMSDFDFKYEIRVYI